MLLLALVYLGGVLTILSPCILPVLPFVFARADRPFLRNGLPILAGMTGSFALVASLAAVAGGWAVRANQYGRVAALVLLALFGATLLFPAVATRLSQPLVSLGARLSGSGSDRGSAWTSLLLGIAVGFLWAPCAGPILGLILTGAALGGATPRTSLLLLVYAAGAATSLALALLAGGRVFRAMKRSLHAGDRVRRVLGAAVLVAVAAIAFGLDTGFLTRLSLARTSAIEEKLVARLQSSPGEAPSMPGPTGGFAARALRVEGHLPPLAGAVQWLNSPPLTPADLAGKVVLVDFWTYSCINCLRALPYVNAWAEKYKGEGLVVIGVHAPEFAFEKDVANVKAAVADLKIGYPVAIDNDYAIWRAFDNHYWPAHYFADAQGRIRHHHFGEGDYELSERIIQHLLAEAGHAEASPTVVAVNGTGAQAPPSSGDVGSPETYVGYDRAERFSSPGGALGLNQWSLSGQWTVGREQAALVVPNGAIAYRFHARDLHLVLGPGAKGKRIRFQVTLDGAAPGADHGMDIDAAGNGEIAEQRLYQLIRQRPPITDHTFEIRFLDAGVEAFAFTFG